ncbi:MAG TPA: hypothetical protein VIL30_02605 [Ramlibacter sp.]|jgi:hypothetical protein
MATVNVNPGRKSIVAMAWEGLRAAEAKDKRGAKSAPEPELAIPKADLVRSEPYRGLVAALPCAHCGVRGFSQAAHPPPTGKGIKESDLHCFPLCCQRIDGREQVQGCHAQFDKYELVPREQMPALIKRWIRQTQKTILTAGTWPKRLAMPKWWKPPKGKK